MPRVADRRPLPFREKDVARAVRAVRAGGEQIDRVGDHGGVGEDR